MIKYDKPCKIDRSLTVCESEENMTCPNPKEENYTIIDFLEELDKDHTWRVPTWFFLYILFSVCLLLFTFREAMQLWSIGEQYLRSKENILEIITIICSWLYFVLVPFKLGYEVEQIFASIGVFCAWIEMSLMMGRIPSIGVFSFMMFQVIQQVFKFFLVFMPTLAAFAFALHFLLIRDEPNGNGVFDNPWSSFLKVSFS